MPYIDSDGLIKDVENLPDCYNGFSDTYDKACIIGLIEEQPTADVVERKRGTWIEHHEPFTWMGYTYWTCSECGFGEDDNKIRSNFCPDCGADMREESNNE